jgi:protein TonB
MAATVSQTLVISMFGSIYRLIAGIVVGLAITAALFWVMPYLIESTDRQLDEVGSTNLVDFVRLKRNETIHRRELKPRKPLPPQSPPPLPSKPQFDSLNPNAETIAISAAPVETDIEISGAGFSLGVGEGDYLPIAGLVARHRRVLRGAVHGDPPGHNSRSVRYRASVHQFDFSPPLTTGCAEVQVQAPRD